MISCRSHTAVIRLQYSPVHSGYSGWRKLQCGSSPQSISNSLINFYSNSVSYLSSITRAGTVRHVYLKYKGIHSHPTLRKRKHKFYTHKFHTPRGCLTLMENEMFMLFGKHEGEGECIQLPLIFYFL
jgi:hypothetical protein